MPRRPCTRSGRLHSRVAQSSQSGEYLPAIAAFLAMAFDRADVFVGEPSAGLAKSLCEAPRDPKQRRSSFFAAASRAAAMPGSIGDCLIGPSRFMFGPASAPLGAYNLVGRYYTRDKYPETPGFGCEQ